MAGLRGFFYPFRGNKDAHARPPKKERKEEQVGQSVNSSSFILDASVVECRNKTLSGIRAHPLSSSLFFLLFLCCSRDLSLFLMCVPRSFARERACACGL